MYKPAKFRKRSTKHTNKKTYVQVKENTVAGAKRKY